MLHCLTRVIRRGTDDGITDADDEIDVKTVPTAAAAGVGLDGDVLGIPDGERKCCHKNGQCSQTGFQRFSGNVGGDGKLTEQNQHPHEKANGHFQGEDGHILGSDGQGGAGGGKIGEENFSAAELPHETIDAGYHKFEKGNDGDGALESAGKDVHKSDEGGEKHDVQKNDVRRHSPDAKAFYGSHDTENGSNDADQIPASIQNSGDDGTIGMNPQETHNGKRHGQRNTDQIAAGQTVGLAGNVYIP